MPPTGRESVTSRSAGATAEAAAAGSSSRESEAISRSIAARSSWSSRPKENRILGRETPASASHSLCASWR